MRKLLIWIGSIFGALVVLVCLAAGIGTMLPKGHSVSRTIRLKPPPEEIWKVLTDHASMPQWRSELKKVERLPDVNGHEMWKEYNSMGEMVLEMTETDPPRRLIGRIAPGQPFGGTWTYELTPESGGTRLKITEDGEVYNPIFRLVSKFMDPAESMTVFMTGLAKKFGEAPNFI